MYPIIVSIPSMLGAFNQSDIFDLGYTQLNGSIPQELMNCWELQSLWLGNNNVTDRQTSLQYWVNLIQAITLLMARFLPNWKAYLSLDFVESYSICVPPFHGAVPNLRVSFTASNKSVCLMTLALLDFHILAKLAVLLLIWVNNSNTNW